MEETKIPDILIEISKSDSQIIEEALCEINESQTLQELDAARLAYITGKKSLVSEASAGLAQLPKDSTKEDRALYGKFLNALKDKLESAVDNKKLEILNKNDEGTYIDVTLPLKIPRLGKLSPDTLIIRKINKFFTYHGFSIAEGPDIETDEYNFEKTSLPKDHPARDLQDTIYIEAPEILLRTHTSSVETRLLTQHKPPLRFVVPGVAYRNEILSPSNHSVFYQYQGVLVDKGLSMANLKGILEEFARYMYGKDIKTRFRTKYYPEVEPGAGMDIWCHFCDGQGCAICKGRGWVEVLGSGVIHRNTLEKCGIDYNEYVGLAFGMGLDRLIMLSTGIEDVRYLHGGTLVQI